MTATKKRSSTGTRPYMRAGSSAWQDLVAARMPRTKRFVEAGDAGMLWRRAKGESDVLIDSSRELIQLYTWLRDATDKQRRDMRAKSWVWDPTTFESLLKAGKPKNKTEAAYRTAYLNRFSKGGLGLELDTSATARARTGAAFLDNLETFAERLAGVELVCANPSKTISKYDDADTLIMLADASEAADALADIKAAKVIASGASLELDGWRSLEIRAEGGSRKIVVAINFDPASDEVAKSGYVYGYDPHMMPPCYRSGSHSHSVNMELREAEMGGWHSHMFMVRGFLVETDYGGEHRHYLSQDGVQAIENTTAHQHEVELGEEEWETELDGWHTHDVDIWATGSMDDPSTYAITHLDGAHRHVVIIDDQPVMSLSPMEFWAIFAEKAVHTSKSMPELATLPDELELLVLAKGDQHVVALRSGEAAECWVLDGAAPEKLCKAALAPEDLDLSSYTLVDKGQARLGVQAPGLREIFVAGAKSWPSHLVIESDGAGWQAWVSARVRPLALSQMGAEIPTPVGKSALPPDVEALVPAELRYWEGTDAAASAAKRTQLVQQLGVRKAVQTMRLFASKQDGEERFVFGVVLAPTTAETPDLQNDFYSAETIRKAAHDYMANYGHVGWQHEAIIAERKVVILESYIAPVDFEHPTVGGAPIMISKGTWLMAFRVVDDDLWDQVKTSVGGLSIGGWQQARVVE